MKKIIISLVITLVVSALFGLMFLENFIYVFVLATILQFVFFYVFNTLYRNFLESKALKAMVDYEKIAQKKVVSVQCPCHEKIIQNIDFEIDKENIYTCQKCERKVKAIAEINTVLTTDPIYVERK